MFSANKHTRLTRLRGKYEGLRSRSTLRHRPDSRKRSIAPLFAQPWHFFSQAGNVLADGSHDRGGMIAALCGAGCPEASRPPQVPVAKAEEEIAKGIISVTSVLATFRRKNREPVPLD